jgi:hypothetical protein
MADGDGGHALIGVLSFIVCDFRLFQEIFPNCE